MMITAAIELPKLDYLGESAFSIISTTIESNFLRRARPMACNLQLLLRFMSLASAACI
jgi:hypothetical protein